MARCYITGVDIPLNESYILDIGIANRTLRSLRQQAAALERLLKQLAERDEVEIYDARLHKFIIRKENRLICGSIAKSLATTYRDEALFTPWSKWQQRFVKQGHKAPTNSNDRVVKDAAPS
jgi:hypothetical protein